MNHHLTDDELIARLYELDAALDHVAKCSECAARWRAFQVRRREAAEPIEISDQMLAAQQHKIMARITQPVLAVAPWRLTWAPALAVAFLLAVGMFLYHPSPSPPAALPEHSETDTQLFTDVYSMEQEMEPRAAAPIRALFEEEQ